jgi:putative ABC transport system ATP-binding protein
MTLRFREVSKRFERPGGDGKLALDGVSFEVGPGELVGVFGPSAAGKTTLLRIAAGMLSADSGWVSYRGERLDRMSVAERKRLRRREIACVWPSQEGQDRLTVLDHVALPLLVDGRDRRLALSRAREALLACEAEQCHEMEMGDLSEGECQRVALARALVSEPKLVLADAPGANLSLPERETIMHLLSRLACEAKVAVLATSSDAESLGRAEQLLYLRGGRLLTSETSGSQGQLYSFPSVLSRRTAADA